MSDSPSDRAPWPEWALIDIRDGAMPTNLGLGALCEECGWPFWICSFSSLEARRRGQGLSVDAKDELSFELLKAVRKDGWPDLVGATDGEPVQGGENVRETDG